eukprot:6526372-Prymnesium_polylepis.1
MCSPLPRPAASRSPSRSHALTRPGLGLPAFIVNLRYCDVTRQDTTAIESKLHWRAFSLGRVAPRLQ